MGFQEAPVVWIDREPTLDEEIDALGDEDVFEMANLDEADTGVVGIIMISTFMGRHGPKVKYFAKPGRTQPSFSVAIASEPRVVAKSVEFDERVFKRVAPDVLAWVESNHAALNRFWWNGNDLTNREVQAVITGLKKIAD